MLGIPTNFWDAQWRFLYRIIALGLYYTLDLWYAFGRRSAFPVWMPLPFNFMYSFSRGSRHRRVEDKSSIVYRYDLDNIEIIAVGDTLSTFEPFIAGMTKTLFIHLGDLCYGHDTIRPFDNFKEDLLLVPGCREMIPFNYHKLWNETYINKYYSTAYYSRKIILKWFSIKIIVIHSFVVPGSRYYYDMIDWLSNAVLSDEKYKIVCSHVAPYSTSRHGPDYLIRNIISAANIEGKFDLYLSAHEHCYQHFNVNGTHYVGNGLGGKSSYNFFSESQNLITKYNEKPAVLKVKICTAQIAIELVNIDQVVIDHFTINDV